MVAPVVAPAPRRLSIRSVHIFLLLVALVLLVAALVCAAVPRHIFGADWDVWLISAFITLVINSLIDYL